MRINSKNKDLIEKMHLISGESKDSIRNFFESLVTLLLVDYLENEKTSIPFFGNVKIKYEKGEVCLEFDPEDVLLKNLDQMKNRKEPDIFGIFKLRIKRALSDYLQ
jgi:hypothetical protein